MFYRRLCNGVADYGTLIPIESNVYDYVDDLTDWYLSIYKYNENHAKEFKKTGSVRGIEDVTTDVLAWDLDCKTDLDKALKETRKLVGYLQECSIISDECLRVCFSGCKGFSVELFLNEDITPEQFKAINVGVAKKLSLETNDTTLTNPSRIFRVLGTKHNVSGLFKCEISVNELGYITIKDLLHRGTCPPAVFRHFGTALPEQLKTIGVFQRVNTQTTVKNGEVDWGNKPHGWSNCKFALLNGYFKQGFRHYPILCIAATCKTLGYPQQVSFHMAKAASEMAAARHGEEEHELEEIERKIEEVYSQKWKGGSFSCRDGNSQWLTDLCNSLGEHKCRPFKANVFKIKDIANEFNTFVSNYDKTIVQTGLPSLDRKVKFFVGTNNCILGAPSAGKSTLVLEIIRHNSKLGRHGVFFSYDTPASSLYARLAQCQTGNDLDDVISTYKNNIKLKEELNKTIFDSFKNVSFNFQAGQTLDEIEETIKEIEHKDGKKIDYVFIDYNELISVDTLDPTEQTRRIALKTRVMAQDRKICLFTLYQPPKHLSDPSVEITTHQGTKGSSAVAASCDAMLSVSRPGFDPRSPHTDRYITINGLKNKYGELFSFDYSWDGATGYISELSLEQKNNLEELRHHLEEQKKNNNEDW